MAILPIEVCVSDLHSGFCSFGDAQPCLKLNLSLNLPVQDLVNALINFQKSQDDSNAAASVPPTPFAPNATAHSTATAAPASAATPAVAARAMSAKQPASQIDARASSDTIVSESDDLQSEDTAPSPEELAAFFLQAHVDNLELQEKATESIRAAKKVCG